METLTLEQISYLAQIIGVIAVIASIIYVGKQLHQNTEQMQTNAALAHSHWSFDIQSTLLNNREVAECWVKGGADFDSLDEVDKQRIMQFEFGALIMLAELYELRQRNLLPDERWKLQTFIMKNVGQRKSVREVWKIFKGGFNKPFQDFMSQFLE